MSNLLEKQAILYLHREGTQYVCKDCVFWKKEKCALYGPSVNIKPYGTCGLFQMKKNSAEIGWLNTTNKQESGYMENKPGFSCKRCDEFLPDEKACKKVDKDSLGDDKGEINPDACCNRWEKKSGD